MGWLGDKRNPSRYMNWEKHFNNFSRCDSLKKKNDFVNVLSCFGTLESTSHDKMINSIHRGVDLCNRWRHLSWLLIIIYHSFVWVKFVGSIVCSPSPYNSELCFWERGNHSIRLNPFLRSLSNRSAWNSGEVAWSHLDRVANAPRDIIPLMHLPKKKKSILQPQTREQFTMPRYERCLSISP